MKKEIMICDVCKKERPDIESYKTIAYRTFDDTDGMTHYSSPRIESVSLDLCRDCALKSTNLFSKGVQCADYEIILKKEKDK